MQKLIYIFLLLASAVSAQTQVIPLNSDSIFPFIILYYSGDETTTKHMMRVTNNNGKYVVEHLEPWYFYGRQTDTVWKVDLNADMVKICARFIDKAKRLPNKCPRSSSSRENFWIELPNMSIKKSGNCDWGDLTYSKLIDTLFTSKFTELENKRTEFKKEMAQKLKGRWFFSEPGKGFERQDTISLLRNADEAHPSSWEFGDGAAFKSGPGKQPNLLHSKTYKLDAGSYDGTIYLQMSDEFIKTKAGEDFFRGATFKLISLSENKMILIFLWD